MCIRDSYLTTIMVVTVHIYAVATSKFYYVIRKDLNISFENVCFQRRVEYDIIEYTYLLNSHIVLHESSNKR